MHVKYDSNTPEAERDLAQTPQWFVDVLEKYDNIKFTLDVCAKPETAKVNTYYSLDHGVDALSLNWLTYNWCNPPFSDVITWVNKAHEQAKLGRVTYLLIPGKTETAYYREAWRVANREIRQPYRLQFYRPNGEPFCNKNGKESTLPYACVVFVIGPGGDKNVCQTEYVDFRSFLP